jgi:metal-responsive CopG/Arc/MetJ family transcriptional regulator
VRAVIDIPDSLLGQLDRLADTAGLSRAEVMRRALTAWVEAHRPEQRQRFYGMWDDHPGART